MKKPNVFAVVLAAASRPLCGSKKPRCSRRESLHGDGITDQKPQRISATVKRDVPVVAKTVGDLRSLSTWPTGLILGRG
jgi:hypothetical protein